MNDRVKWLQVRCSPEEREQLRKQIAIARKANPKAHVSKLILEALEEKNHNDWIKEGVHGK